MTQKSKKFSPQSKAEAAQFVLKKGLSIAKVTADLGINAGTLGNWVGAWREDNP